MAKLLLMNGPNLNLLGTREPDIYGGDTLPDIESRLAAHARALGHELVCFQSNAEHELVERVQRAAGEAIDWIVINPAAFTHTSIALRDALAAVGIPFTEVHLSNIHRREAFRRHSHFSDLAEGVISGLGIHGYEAAVFHAHARLAAGNS